MSKLAPRAAVVALGFALWPALAAAQEPAGLDRYVKGADLAFSWSVAASDRTPQGTVHHIKLRSQVELS